jgi:hypothetical protein
MMNLPAAERLIYGYILSNYLAAAIWSRTRGDT